jgi:hypothetical protein
MATHQRESSTAVAVEDFPFVGDVVAVYWLPGSMASCCHAQHQHGSACTTSGHRARSSASVSGLSAW